MDIADALLLAVHTIVTHYKKQPKVKKTAQVGHIYRSKNGRHYLVIKRHGSNSKEFLLLDAVDPANQFKVYSVVGTTGTHVGTYEEYLKQNENSV